MAFNYGVINRNLATWFRAPASNDLQTFKDAADMLDKEMGDETQAQAELLAAQPETRQLLLGGGPGPGFLQEFCRRERTEFRRHLSVNQKVPVASWGPYAAKNSGLAGRVAAQFPVMDGGRAIGSIAIAAPIPLERRRRRY